MTIRDPVIREYQFLAADNDRCVRQIQQLQNQIAQLEGQLSPEIVRQVRDLSKRIEDLHAEVIDLELHQLLALRDDLDKYKSQYEYFSNEVSPRLIREASQRREEHNRKLERLIQNKSELSDQLKRYEETYGPLRYQKRTGPWVINF